MLRDGPVGSRKALHWNGAPISMKYQQFSINDGPGVSLWWAWLPAAIGVGVICFESTATMSGANTGRWLLTLCHWLWGQTDKPWLETVNFILRKSGHFCGYGTLGLLFRRGWFHTFRWHGPRSPLPASSAFLGVVCTFIVASLDELHQRSVPGRTSSIYDVMIDTLGAILFNLVFMFFMYRNTPKFSSVSLEV
jgi:VanZ family protein